MGEQFLLLKRGYYWRPNSQGYTVYKNEAGRYSYEDAQDLENEKVLMVHEKEACHFSPAASDSEKLVYYKINSDRLEAINAELVEALEALIFCETNTIDSAYKTKALIAAQDALKKAKGEG